MRAARANAARDKRLVGIVSIADLAGKHEEAAHAGEALGEIARPSAFRSQII